MKRVLQTHCYLAWFRQWREEEEGRQISGLFKRTSPTEVFLTGRKSKNSLLQMDSVGFEEYRKTQRIVHSWEGGGISKEEMLT